MSNEPDKRSKDRSAAILLVEEDDAIRRQLFWALYVEGFKVLTAHGATDAQRLSRDVPGPIEVLLIGSLPTGDDAGNLHEQLSAERPELQIVAFAGATPPKAPRTLDAAARPLSFSTAVNAEEIVQRVRTLLRERGATR